MYQSIVLIFNLLLIIFIYSMGLYLSKQGVNDYIKKHNVNTSLSNWSNLIQIRNEYFQERIQSHRVVQELLRIDATDDESHPFIAVAGSILDKMLLER